MSKPEKEKWVVTGEDYSPSQICAVSSDNQPLVDRPPSQELTMFSPYNSLKNTEAKDSTQQTEVLSVQGKGETKEGSARVFFRKIFSSSQPPQTSNITTVSTKQPTNQKASSTTTNQKASSVATNQKASLAATNQKASTNQKAPVVTASQKSTPGAQPGPSKGQSSRLQTVENEQTKVLVRPARGGTSNSQKQSPQTRGTQPPKFAAPNRAPPPKQSQPGAARWNSSSEAVALETPELSLTSYARPRQNVPTSRSHQPPSKGNGRSGLERSGQVNRSEVLSRFGLIENDQEGADLKKYWMPDNACKDCSDCGVKFTLFIRRHHCRICGRIYCNSCCSLTIPAAELRPNLQGNLRVCKECKHIFREFHSRKPKQDSLLQSSEGQSSDSSLSPRLSITLTPVKGQVMSGDQPPSLPSTVAEGSVLKSGSGTYNRVMATRPVSVLSPHKSWDDTSGRSQELLDMSPSRLGEFDLYRFGRRGGMTGLTGFDSLTAGQREGLLDLDEDELEAIVTGVWLKLLDPEMGLPRQNHRYRLRTFPNTYSAHELVEWLVINEHVRSREVAIRVGQALVDTNRLSIVSTMDPEFRDDSNLFLELGEAAKLLPEYSESPLLTDAPKWFQHLRDDEELDQYRDKTDSDVTKDFIHVPPHRHRSPSTEKGLVVSSVSLAEMEKRKSRGISYSSLGRGEAKTEDEYLIIDREQSLKVKQDPPYIPTMPGIEGPNRQSFSLIGNEEIVQSIPVEGLSAATEAAREYAEEKSKHSIPNDKALSHYERTHDRHFHTLMIQQMKNLGLNLHWLEIIRPLIMEACRNVRTDCLPSDQMDINQYVKIKKIPRGRKINSTLVYGVVCTKNVTHKKMLRSIKNPKILLLNCAFEFQRKENQLSSFDTLQLQEEKYLKNLVVKVSTIKPNLILVQKSVSRLALEMLFDLGIVVAVNVKPTVMDRVARCTKGQILHSLDQLMFGTASIFGTCGHFYIKTYLLPDGDKKTLMYFDHCPPQLGCVITLQGASMKELKKVKKVTEFGLHIAHNSILETHFLVDEFAWPTEDATEPSLYDDYTSTCLTPEWPLYPSLGYPLDTVSQGELQKKLEALKHVKFEHADCEGDRQLDDETSAEGVPNPPQDTQAEAPPVAKEVVCTVDVEPSDEEQGADRSLQTVQETDEEELETKTGEQPADISTVPKEQIEPQEDAISTQEDELISEVVEEEPPLTMRPAPKSSKVTSKMLDKLAEGEFKLAYQSQTMSISPYVKFKIPYLQTPHGRSADARQYLPSVIYWSFQFKARNLLKHTQKLESKSGNTPHLEMGLTKSAIHSSLESNIENELQLGLVPTQPSYKSVSSHPFTDSIFLIKANSLEMRAALADFRARAGYEDEQNTFLFKSAERASNYHLYLEERFSKCRPFEEAAAALEESPASAEKEGSVASSRSDVKAKRNLWEREFSKASSKSGKGRDPFNKLMPSKLVPKVSKKKKVESTTSSEELNKEDSSKDKDVTDGEQQITADNSVVSQDIEPVSQGILVVSTDEEGVTLSSEHMAPSTSESGSEEDSTERLPTRTGSHKNRDSGGGLKLSEKLGTLDDFDRNRRSKAEGEEENLENYGDLYYENWLAADEQRDCFDPGNHQSISILFSNTAHDGLKHQDPCVAPCMIPMFYYGRNDIALGEFLHRYCFRPFYRCQTCGSDMVQHQRHVIHGLAAIHISMQQLVSPLPGNDDGVYTWLACKYCDQCTPYTKMSRESLLFSFAKFLELKFHCETYVTRYHGDDNSDCSHSLHKGYVQYFLHKDKIAAFQPDMVELLEVLIPPRTISISTPRRKYHLDFRAEIKHSQRIIEGVFYRIIQKLEKYRLDPVTQLIDNHIANSKVERDALRLKVKQLKDLVVSGCQFQKDGEKESLDCDQEAAIIGHLQDSIADLKRCVADVVDCWNIHLEDLDVRVREYRRKMRERDSAQGESSRDSPAVAPPITTPPQSSVATTETSRSSPDPTPCDIPSDHTHSGDLEPSSSTPNLMAEGTADPLTNSGGKSHSRNLSEGGILQPQEEKTHKRQLSDSATLDVPKGNHPPLKATPLYGSEAGFSSTDALTTPSGGPSLSELTEGETPSQGEIPSEAEEEVVNKPTSEEGPLPKEEDSSSGEKKTELTETGEDATSVPTPRQLSEVVKTTGREDREQELQTDSAGGILARFRGKEAQDIRDDPTKFYLLDPYLITTTSPSLGRASQPASHSASPNPDPPVKSGKKPSSTQKRSSVAGGVTDSHSESSKAEKRATRDKEKVGVLARQFQRLPAPFPVSEHHTMHSIITIPIGIYEKEPTSIIAFALSSREYKRKLTLLQEKSAVRVGGASAKVVDVNPQQLSSSPKLKRQFTDSEKAPPPAANATTLKTNFKAVINELKKKGSSISLFSGSASISTSQTSPENFDPSVDHHRRLEFTTSYSGKSHDPSIASSRLSDPSSEGAGPSVGGGPEDMDTGKATPHVSLEFTSPDKQASFFCKVYYAEDFRRLRELIFPSGEESFVRSLSRCIKYDAKGGKSRSAFCKVADDRFILKQVKSIEISSFELFAPHYLQHVTKALEDKRPLTLAKIFGAYSIGFRNSRTGSSKRLDVLIMENLLYGHNTHKVFDLKGSMRSRYIDPSKESSGDVLLDENYLNAICCNPVYVHPHSKCVLMQAILADSEFLAQNAIMDYSLLTCIDESTGELVVGIIDYIRTFTLDKRLEMYLKKTAGKVLPTVVYPELYRKRFCEAMDRYFTVVPDKWTGLGADIKFF